MRLHLRLVFPLLLALAGRLSAGVTVFTWTGTTSGNFGTGTNWSGNSLPVSDGNNTPLVFAATLNANVSLTSPFDANSIMFTAPYPHYVFSGSGGASLGIGSGGITLATPSGGNSLIDFASGLSLRLLANQTWTTNGSSSLTVAGDITGAFSLTKAGSGTLTLGGNGNFSGGVTVNGGTLNLTRSSSVAGGSVTSGPVGTGTLTLANGTILTNSASGVLTLDNPLAVTGNVTIDRTRGDGDIVLTGNITGTANLTVSSPEVANQEDDHLKVTFRGNNSFAGNLTVTASSLILDSANALPSKGVAVKLVDDGYIGYTENSFGTFAAFKSAITGTGSSIPGDTIIGIDSADPSNPRTVSDAINLSGLGADFGTATKVIVSGTISSPNGSNLALTGVNGGYLKITSPLTGTNGITTVSVGAASETEPGDVTYQGYVELANATSNYTGNTTLKSGYLLVGASGNGTGGPIGTGTLNVAVGGTPDVEFPTLAASVNGVTLPNNIALSSALSVGVPVTANPSSTAYPLQSLSFSANNLTLAGVISGAGALTQNGTGTLTLSGANTYTGVTTVTAGTVAISADTNLGLAPGSATPGQLVLNGGALETTANVLLASNRGLSIGANGGTINADLGTTLTYSGILAGSGALTKTGGGTLTLGGSNTFGGGLAINAGQVSIGSDANLGASTGALALNNGVLITTATMTLGSARNVSLGTLGSGSGFSPATGTTLTYGGSISGNGGLTKYNNGTLILSGANTFTGTTTIINGSGALVVANAMALAGSTLDYESTGGTLTFGALGFPVSSATLGGLAGNKNLPLQYTNDGVAVPVALTVGANNQSTNYSGVLSDPVSNPGASLTKSGTGRLILAGANTYTGSTTIVGGTLTLGIANALSSATDVNLSFGGTTLDLNGFATTVGSIAGVANTTVITTGGLATADNNSTTFSGTLTGAGSFSKNGTGTLTLSGTNNYNGGTIIFGGTLDLTGAIAPGGDVTVNSPGVFKVDANQQIRRLSGAGTVSVGSGKALTVNLPGPTDPTHTTSTFAGNITGLGSLNEAGGGTLTLTGSSDYSGGTMVNSGTLILANGTGSAVGIGDITVGSPGTLIIGDGTNPVGGLFGNITNSGTAIYNRPDNTTYNGILSGNGLFVKQGAGTLTLNATTSYTGGSTTKVSAGTLVIGATNALPTSTQLSLALGSTVEVANNQTIAGFSGNSAGSSLLIDAAQALTVAMPVANTFTNYSGNINLGPAGPGTGTFAVMGATGGGDIVYLANPLGANIATVHDGNSTIVIGNAALSLPANGALQFSGNTTQTLSNVISGSNVSLIFSAGNTTFTGSNTYSGTTAITGGKLVVNNSSGSATGTATVTVSGGGTIGGNGTISGPLVVASGGVVSPGNSPGALTVGPTTFTGGARFAFDINDANGTAGTSWDLLNITGGLLITSTSLTPFVISLNSLNGLAAGQAANFNSSQSYSWKFVSATGVISGLTSAAVFSFDTTNFQNSLGVGSFFVSQTGNDLFLNFTPIPEPSTWALLATGLGACGLVALRRRKK